MENAQRDLLRLLLGRLLERGLLSEAVYAGAEDLVRSMPDLPVFFRAMEEGADGAVGSPPGAGQGEVPL